MNSTQLIHDLVRGDRVTPNDGAMLLELRGDVSARRERRQLRRNPFAQLAVVFGVFVLALLGVRRD